MTETTPAVVETKSRLVRVGNKDRSLVGWTMRGLTEHLHNHLIGKRQWCDPNCLARTFTGIASQTNRKGVRHRLSRSIGQLIDRGLFLSVEYAPRANGHHGEALRWKLFDAVAADPSERQYALEQLETWRRRKEISEARYEKGKLLVTAP